MSIYWGSNKYNIKECVMLEQQLAAMTWFLKWIQHLVFTHQELVSYWKLLFCDWADVFFIMTMPKSVRVWKFKDNVWGKMGVERHCLSYLILMLIKTMIRHLWSECLVIMQDD